MRLISTRKRVHQSATRRNGSGLTRKSSRLAKSSRAVPEKSRISAARTKTVSKLNNRTSIETSSAESFCPNSSSSETDRPHGPFSPDSATVTRPSFSRSQASRRIPTISIDSKTLPEIGPFYVSWDTDSRELTNDTEVCSAVRTAHERIRAHLENQRQASLSVPSDPSTNSVPGACSPNRSVSPNSSSSHDDYSSDDYYSSLPSTPPPLSAPSLGFGALSLSMNKPRTWNGHRLPDHVLDPSCWGKKVASENTNELMVKQEEDDGKEMDRWLKEDIWQ